MLSVNQSVTGAELTLVSGRIRAVLIPNVQGLVIGYYLHHLCVRIQSEEFQTSFTPHFGLNISGTLLKKQSRTKGLSIITEQLNTEIETRSLPRSEAWFGCIV